MGPSRITLPPLASILSEQPPDGDVSQSVTGALSASTTVIPATSSGALSSFLSSYNFTATLLSRALRLLASSGELMHQQSSDEVGIVTEESPSASSFSYVSASISRSSVSSKMFLQEQALRSNLPFTQLTKQPGASKQQSTTSISTLIDDDRPGLSGQSGSSAATVPPSVAVAGQAQGSVAETSIQIVRYPCIVTRCKKSYSTQQFLNEHIITHTEGKPHQCPQCLLRFTTLKGLKRHQDTHSGKPYYKCRDCSASFWQKSQLKSHIRSTHLGDFNCESCTLSFRTAAVLVKHKTMHTTMSSNGPKCQECGKQFLSHIYLSRHRNTVHEKHKPFVCSECGLCLFTNRDLVAHQRTHTREKPFACSICDKRFIKKASLAQHHTVHDKQDVELQPASSPRHD